MNNIIPFFNTENSQWIQIIIVVFLSFLTDFIQRKIFTGLNKRFERTKNKWDDALTEAAPPPLSLIIWTTGSTFAMKIAQDHSKFALLKTLDSLSNAIVLGSLAWFLFRLTDQITQSTLEENRVDRATVDAINKLTKASVSILTILALLQTFGFSVSGVLAFGGIGGIAIGFAAKDLLANFFGGLMIFLDRPFAVGDWIRSPDREIEGSVEHIGWRVTQIRTFDKRPVYVPNAVFSNIALENPQRMLNRRIHETIGVRYEDASKIPKIVRKVKEMLINHKEIDAKKTLIVNLVSFAPSSLDFFIYTFTKTTDWISFHEVKQDVLLKILKIIEDEGAQTAYPTSTIHLQNSQLTEVHRSL